MPGLQQSKTSKFKTPVVRHFFMKICRQSLDRFPPDQMATSQASSELPLSPSSVLSCDATEHTPAGFLPDAVPARFCAGGFSVLPCPQKTFPAVPILRLVVHVVRLASGGSKVPCEASRDGFTSRPEPIFRWQCGQICRRWKFS